MKKFFFRALIAAPFFVIGFTLKSFAAIASPFLFLIGALILAKPLTAFAAEWVGNRLMSLYHSGEHFDRPQPMYSVPQANRAKGFYEEAMAGFEKIAADYPEELKPYVEMIDIAIVNLHDGERADRIFQQGMTLLQSEKDKEALARLYAGIRTRLETRSQRYRPVQDPDSSKPESITPWSRFLHPK